MVKRCPSCNKIAEMSSKYYTLLFCPCFRSGTPELELGDWKENRKYRVLAIDNGILTFRLIYTSFTSYLTIPFLGVLNVSGNKLENTLFLHILTFFSHILELFPYRHT